jgi:polyphosphate glucokinase
VLLTTLGTGIGTALFTQGRLVPYTELGHIEMNGADAETQAAESVKTRLGLSYSEWAARLQQYYSLVELFVAPDVIIVGGGVSKSHSEFLPLISTRAKLKPAKLLNNAGIVGAAMIAVNGGRR